MEEDPAQQKARQQIRPPGSGQPDHPAGRGDAQAVDQIVPGAEPDGADVGVALAEAHE